MSRAEFSVPFNQPSLEGSELAYLTASLRQGPTSANGPHSAACREILTDWLGAQETLLTTSCTDALELAAMQLEVGPDDVVIVPDFTFTSTALAFARAGARIRFCDIEPRTLGLDPEHLATLMDEQVTAVVVVHYAGIPCEIDRIQQVLAGWPRASLVEDNAHALFARWQGRPLGSFGRFATQSFHETKNFSCGEGGALVANEERDVDRARVLYDKGTNRQAFFLGQVDKYSWQDTGSSFGLSDTLAGQLRGQLEQREQIQRLRRAVWRRYAERLAPVAEKYGLGLPVVPDGAEQAYHLFHVLLPEPSWRPEVLSRMREHGVNPTFHYVPLSGSPAGRRFADADSPGPAGCPVARDMSSRLIRLPFFARLSEPQTDRVVAALASALRACVSG